MRLASIGNGVIDIAWAADVGPRILRFGFIGGENVFGECPQAEVRTELGAWKPYGGHRLWMAPERMPDTYAPECEPIEVMRVSDRVVRLRREIRGVLKEIAVELRGGSTVSVHHRISNRTPHAIEAAAWALTILASGGTALLPQEPHRPHPDGLLPTRPMALWPYSDLGDPRWKFGQRFVRLRCDPERPQALKIGAGNRQGWLAYYRNGLLFVKRFPFREGAAYPDFGSNCELFTKGGMIELESLGPLERLEPGQAIEHIETWSLHRLDKLPEPDGALHVALEPLLRLEP